MATNENIMELETVFDKEVTYKPDFRYVDALVSRSEELLNEYFEGVLTDDEGLWKMFGQDGVFWKQKGWFISAMEKDPRYNGNLQIVLKNQEYHRYISTSVVEEFYKYARRFIRENKTFTNGREEITYEEWHKRIDEMDDKKVRFRERYAETRFLAYIHAIQYLEKKSVGWKENPNCYFVAQGLRIIKDYVLEEGTHIINDEVVEEINNLAEAYGIKFRGVQSGQKATRLIQNLCKLVKMDKDVKIVDESFVRQDGVVVTRKKDMGWNKQYAALCDNLNPLTVKGTAVISVNPIDFFTMSFGKGWASCHTIDKKNKRSLDSAHNYSGCYCGGTESYMLDNSSVLFYFLPEDWNGERPELEDKVKRCVFYLGEDKLIQSRVYPDGRDGGDMSLAGDIRAIMQKVIADLFDVPNYWKVEKGTSACYEVIRSYGPHYRDYENYDDCNVSFMKRVDGYINRNTIDVGSRIICPCCGDWHYTEDNIFCDDCLAHVRGYQCYNCDEFVYADDAIEINGRYYCRNCTETCEDCCDDVVTGRLIRTSGDHYVCDYCLRNNYTWSEYEGEYIHDQDVIITEEGRECSSEGDGWFECDRCGAIHNIENAFDHVEGTLCENCYIEVTEEEEGGEE